MRCLGMIEIGAIVHSSLLSLRLEELGPREIKGLKHFSICASKVSTKCFQQITHDVTSQGMYQKYVGTKAIAISFVSLKREITKADGRD